MGIDTLQERIEQRARRQAQTAAAMAIQKLACFQDNVVLQTNTLTYAKEEHAQTATIPFSVLVHALRRFYERNFYDQYLDELTQALVANIKLVDDEYNM